ncbi:hypothetical protein NHQ30_004646 [Ciborinia camelliae]|nr:hypothetical protein NHQ30_004646 [Ciborinia camelliae]
MASDNMPFPDLVAGATPAQICSILGIDSDQISTSSSAILSEFHCFPELPPELRIMIWRAYFKQLPGRIIEIEPDRTNIVDSHAGYRATKVSSRVPPALRNLICKDARKEALHIYQLWRLDNRPDGHTPPPQLIYFNPSIDIIYFGRRTCFAIMCFFVDSLVRAKKYISRVAISSCYDNKLICTSSESLSECSYARGRFDLPINAPNSAIYLHPLHGMQIDKLPALRAGWPGLEEVLCVVLNNYETRVNPERVDENITFRPPTFSTPWDLVENWDFYDDIQEVKNGEMTSFTNWEGCMQPTFSFVSLSPRPKYGKVYDSLTLAVDTDLSWKDYIKDIEKLSSSHCRLKVRPKMRGSNFAEPIKYVDVEFYGTKEGVFIAKKACL